MQLVIDGIYLWAFFSQSRQELIDRCIDGSTDQDVRNICDNSFNTGKWSLVAGIVIGLIIQLCECLCLLQPLLMAKRGGVFTSLCAAFVDFYFPQGAAYIVTSYAKKLKEHTLWRSGPGIAPVHPAPGPGYAHVKHDDHESNIPLTNASYTYPYKDTNHSFGART